MDRTDQNQRLLVPALLGAVACISFAAIFFRLAAPTHPLVSAGLRLAMAAVVLAPSSVRAIARGRLRGAALRGAAVAGLLYGLHFGAWVWSLDLTSVAASVTIVTATPLLLAVLGLVTGRDRPGPRLWLSIGLGLAGLLIIGGAHLAGGGDALVGDALAGLGAAAMAGYLLVGRSLGDSLEVLPFSGVATAVGAVSLLGTAVVCGIPVEAASPEALFWIALAALIPQLVGHNLLTWSLRHARPTAVGVATLGEPVGATFLGWLWLGQAVPPSVLAGCTVTLAAVVIAVQERPVAPPLSVTSP